MITLTETAAKKISDLKLEEGKPEWGLRIRVVGGGCSGMSYELGWDDARCARDGFTVIIHGKHYHEETRATASQVERYPGGEYLVVPAISALRALPAL